MANYSPKAYITLLYDEGYLPGVIVLAQALISHKCIYPKLIMVTSNVSKDCINSLGSLYDEVIHVNELHSDESGVEFQLLGRPELNLTFTKINAWNQTRYSQLVYLDADTLPVCNIDGLFNEFNCQDPRHVAASPDIGWPDIFNSGVLVLNTSKFVFNDLVACAQNNKSFDGGDQGLLNQYFHGDRWVRLPFTYNVTPSSAYQYQPAYRFFKKDISIIHFTGNLKPWFGDSTDDGVQEMTVRWKQEYNKYLEKTGQMRQDIVDQQSQVMSSFRPDATVTYESTSSAKVSETLYPPSEAKFANFPVQSEPNIVPERLVLPKADRWDATKFLPPLDSKPEAANLVIHQYSNAWDSPNKEPERVFSETFSSKSKSRFQDKTESVSSGISETQKNQIVGKTKSRRTPRFASKTEMIREQSSDSVRNDLDVSGMVTTLNESYSAIGRSKVNPPVRPPTPGPGAIRSAMKKDIDRDENQQKNEEEEEEKDMADTYDGAEDEERHSESNELEDDDFDSDESNFIPPLLGATVVSLPFESISHKAERVFPEDVVYGMQNLQFDSTSTNSSSQNDIPEAGEKDEVDSSQLSSTTSELAHHLHHHHHHHDHNRIHLQHHNAIRTSPSKSTSVWDNDPNIARYMSMHEFRHTRRRDADSNE